MKNKNFVSTSPALSLLALHFADENGNIEQIDEYPGKK